MTQGVVERMRLLGYLEKQISEYLAHITFLTLIIKDQRVRQILESYQFTTFAHNLIASIFAGEKLVHIQNSTSTLGKGVAQFLVTKYSLSNPDKITDFRTAIYIELNKCIKAISGSTVQRQRKPDPITDDKIAVDEKGHEWYATPAHSYGKNVWVGHLSFGNIKGLKTSNPTLYQRLVQQTPNGTLELHPGAVKEINSHIGNHMVPVLGRGVIPFPKVIEVTKMPILMSFK